MVDPASRLLQDSANSSHHIGENYYHSSNDYHHQNSFNHGNRTQHYADYSTTVQNSFESEALGSNINDVDDSESDTPPLWQTSPLSPSSRTEAIVRGQRQLMEMVSKMPESYYELSLRDLVEKPVIIEDRKIITVNNDEKVKEDEKVYPKKNLQQQKSKSGGNSGLLLNMFFPVPLGSKKKKKNKTKKNDCSNTKVSPRPSPVCENDKEKEWWKKRSESGSGVGSTSSDNSRSSKSSGSRTSRSSSNRSNTRHGGRTCWAFFTYKKKAKSAK